MKLNVDRAMTIISSGFTGTNMLVINEMELTGITFTEGLITISIINKNTYKKFTGSSIQFVHCSFTNIKGNSRKGSPGLITIIKDVSNRIEISVIMILHCRFSNINTSAIVSTQLQGATPHTVLLIFVQNTSFSFLSITDVVFWLECTYLKLGPAIFTRIQSVAVIYLLTSTIEIDSDVILHTTMETIAL